MESERLRRVGDSFGRRPLGRAIVAIATTVFLLGTILWAGDGLDHGYRGVLAVLGLPVVYLIYKLGLSALYSPAPTDQYRSDWRVTAIIPCYNESPDSVARVLDCLAQQTHPVAEILFVDDGSSDTAGFERALAVQRAFQEEIAAGRERPHLVVHRFAENRGKKQALAWALREAQGDLVLMVDSDGLLSPEATRELTLPFADERVGAVGGNIAMLDYRRPPILRLQDIVYTSAFQAGRTAQSVTGSVIVCSGALSMYRRELVVAHLDEFLDNSFLGVNLVTGDDRVLTGLVLKYGYRTRFQSTAVCFTRGPATVRSFVTQQIRWTRSAYLYALQSMKWQWRRPWVLVWLLFETYLWLICLIIAAAALVLTPGIVLSWSAVLFAAAYFVATSYLLRLYYVFVSPVHFLLGPLYGMAYQVLLIWIRMVALFTVRHGARKGAWGTR